MIVRRILLFLFILVSLVLLAAIIYGSYFRRIKLSDSIPEVENVREAKLLTSFFGLDNALPIRALMLYPLAVGKDGMPLVFSQEINPTTLDNTDFKIVTENGDILDVEFVTLKPANEEFELRTVLLIGEFGNFPDSPPKSVEIVGDLFSRSGKNYKGQKVEVISLDQGPVLSYAEYFTFDDEYPYISKGGGCDCERGTTETVVRTVWAGGVRALNGQELGKNELTAFEIMVVNGRDTVLTHPFAIADVNDNDNNIDLCLKEKGLPLMVKVDEGIAIDPRNDPNPKTEITIVSRW